MHRRTALIPLLAAAVLTLAACGGSDPADDSSESEALPTTSATPADPPEPEAPLRVFWVRDGVLAAAPVTSGQGSDLERAVQTLFAGPDASASGLGMTSQVPAGLPVHSAVLGEDGIATIDVGDDFSEGEQDSIETRTAQLVYTATQFPGVRGVQILFDGHRNDLPDADNDPSNSAFTRHRFEAQAPAVLVETPLPLSTISSPVRIAGTANTYEANFQVEVLDAAGQKIGGRFVTATSGSGQRGTFDEQVEFDAPAGGEGTILVYEDAQGGTRMHDVRIPVRFGSDG